MSAIWLTMLSTNPKSHSINNFLRKKSSKNQMFLNWFLGKILFWGYSSAGRALEWHSRGQRFDPAYLHQKVVIQTISKKMRDAACDNGEDVREHFGATGFFFVVERNLVFNRINQCPEGFSKLRRDAPVFFYP